jgi:hypothetical protein
MLYKRQAAASKFVPGNAGHVRGRQGAPGGWLCLVLGACCVDLTLRVTRPASGTRRGAAHIYDQLAPARLIPGGI